MKENIHCKNNDIMLLSRHIAESAVYDICYRTS